MSIESEVDLEYATDVVRECLAQALCERLRVYVSGERSVELQAEFDGPTVAVANFKRDDSLHVDFDDDYIHISGRGTPLPATGSLARFEYYDVDMDQLVSAVLRFRGWANEPA